MAFLNRTSSSLVTALLSFGTTVGNIGVSKADNTVVEGFKDLTFGMSIDAAEKVLDQHCDLKERYFAPKNCYDGSYSYIWTKRNRDGELDAFAIGFFQEMWKVSEALDKKYGPSVMVPVRDSHLITPVLHIWKSGQIVLSHRHFDKNRYGTQGVIASFYSMGSKKQIKHMKMVEQLRLNESKINSDVRID